MKEEIDAAVHFFGRVIVASNKTMANLKEFQSCLTKLMEKKFQGHWHNEVPGKGQGYRSIRLHPSEPLDPVLEKAAVDSDFSHHNFSIPMEFTLWVDPKDVSCRFGDLKATYCTVLKDKDNQASALDVDELLESAKALYTRQERLSISQSTRLPPPSHPIDIYSGFEPHGGNFSSSPPYFPPDPMFSSHHYMMGGNWGSEGFTTPPPPFHSHTPPSPPQFPPSFLSSAVNTTPRKNHNHGNTNSNGGGSAGKTGSFRRNSGNGNTSGGNGVGRGSRHHHSSNNNSSSGSNGEGGSSYNHNHNTNNNHATNGSSSGSNGNGWSGDRYHWVKGSKGAGNKQEGK